MDLYRERLHAAPGYWVLTGVVGAFAIAMFWPVDVRLAAASGVLAVAGAVVGLLRAGVLLEVRDGELRAGTAHIGVDLLADAEALDAEATRRALGPELDARAFGCTRPWVRTAVRVALTDPADPTPYWLVSTRRPKDLVAALAEARAADGTQAAHSEQTNRPLSS